MLQTSKSKAEQERNAMRKKAKRSLNEKERALQERAEHTARLRAIRLAREAAAEKEHGKDASGKNKRPLRLPKVHRPQT